MRLRHENLYLNYKLILLGGTQSNDVIVKNIVIVGRLLSTLNNLKRVYHIQK